MFKTIRNAFKVKELKSKLLYTFMMLVVIRFGSALPIPGVRTDFFANWFAKQTTDVFGFFNAMTGGSFSQMSIFALSITPYITSSIIIQLLTIAIPKLEELQKDGEDGRKKIQEYTRYVTVGLALIESSAMAIGFGRQGLLADYNAWNIIVAIVTMTTGSALLMWIGEQITDKGVGNGISIVLLLNILSSVPSDIRNLYFKFVFGQDIPVAALRLAIVVLVIVAMVVFVIVLNDAERRIPVQYSKKMVGRKLVGGTGVQHSAEGEHRRRNARYFRFLHHVIPGSDLSVHSGDAAGVERPSDEAAQLRFLVQAERANLFHWSVGVYHPDRAVCLFLYFHRV